MNFKQMLVESLREFLVAAALLAVTVVAIVLYHEYSVTPIQRQCVATFNQMFPPSILKDSGDTPLSICKKWYPG